MVMDVVGVEYGKHKVGAVSYDSEEGIGHFEYSASFLNTGIELSPI